MNGPVLGESVTPWRALVKLWVIEQGFLAVPSRRVSGTVTGQKGASHQPFEVPLPPLESQLLCLAIPPAMSQLFLTAGRSRREAEPAKMTPGHETFLQVSQCFQALQ